MGSASVIFDVGQMLVDVVEHRLERLKLFVSAHTCYTPVVVTKGVIVAQVKDATQLVNGCDYSGACFAVVFDEIGLSAAVEMNNGQGDVLSGCSGAHCGSARLIDQCSSGSG